MKLVPNRFDIMFDEKSEKPGEQRLEKMVSGRYMGELFALALADVTGEKDAKYDFTAVDMSGIIMDGSENLDNAGQIINRITGKVFSQDEFMDFLKKKFPSC